MSCDRRQRDPDMAINILPAVRSRRRVTVNSGTGNLRAISRCRTIVNCHKNSSCVFVNSAYHNFKQFSRYGLRFLAQRTDRIIVGFVAAVNACCPKPACNGFSAFGKEHRSEYDAKSPCRAWCRTVLKVRTITCQKSGKIYWVNMGSPFLKCLCYPLDKSEGWAVFIYTISF